MTRPPAGHRIRLRGPWSVTRQEGSVPDAGVTKTQRHPDDWPRIVRDQGGRVRLERRFHAPSRLDDTETVFVVLTGVRGTGEVRLNDRPLGTFDARQAAWEFRVPAPLPFTNLLSISVAYDAPTPDEPDVGLYGSVALDIRKS